MTADERPSAGTYGGLFLVTSSTLMLEIALDADLQRDDVVPLRVRRHLGGAVRVDGGGARRPPAARTGSRAPVCTASYAGYTLAFAVSIALCFAVQLAIPFTPHLSVGGVASVVGTCVVISIPFVFSGIVVCLALTRFPAEVNRLYAVDLIGAGVGLRGPRAPVLVVRWTQPGGVRRRSGGRRIAGLRGGAPAPRRVDRPVGRRSGRCSAASPSSTSSATTPATRCCASQWAKEARDPVHDYERWNAFSGSPWIGDPADPDRPLLDLVIDSTAGTFLGRWSGDLSETDFLPGPGPEHGPLHPPRRRRVRHRHGRRARRRLGPRVRSGFSGRLDDLVEQPTPDGQGGLVAEVQPVES